MLAEADDLLHWDTAFWSERIREEKYGLSDEELRPYFPLPQVLDGLFSLAHRPVFGVTITAADGEAPIWHSDVSLLPGTFLIIPARSSPTFTLDPTAALPEKRGGAWMDECLTRGKFKGLVRLPVAYLGV